MQHIEQLYTAFESLANGQNSICDTVHAQADAYAAQNFTGHSGYNRQQRL